MASSVKSGFSTINRLLGKKSKDDGPNTTTATAYNSTGGSPSSMFSRSMSNLDTTSQYNKIVPLAAMSNAPFEQTFRITVALPRDQLYVVRVGAKMKLHQILDMTCTAKQLDRDKFEFRHPTDNAMVFPNECTIGEVGFNEIRLVPILEPNHSNNFSSADLGRMRPGNRNSYAAPSSNGMSIYNRSGHTETPSKSISTTSPYSSTNSLNSLESGQSRPPQQRQPSGGQPVAPMRKKRAAPRPPPQNVIPEDSPIRHMSFHVSSPNLSQPLSYNGQPEDEERSATMRPMSMFQEDVERKRPVSRTPSNVSVDSNTSGAPNPVPRQRSANGFAKRKKAAPAPPPRSRENLTLPHPPVPTPRTITPVHMDTSVEPKETNNVSKTLLNSEVIPVEVDVHVNGSIRDQSNEFKEPGKGIKGAEKHSNSPDPPGVELEVKQNGSPVSIAIVTSNVVPDTPQVEETKAIDPSSDEDDGDCMNIYNLNTRKCVEAEVVPENGGKATGKESEMMLNAMEGIMLDRLQKNSAVEDRKIVVEDLYAEVKKPQKKSTDQLNKEDRDQRSDSPLWTYTLPAPPHFADGNNNNLLMTVNGTEGKRPQPTAVPTETFNSNVYYNYTENDDGDSIATRSMTTTVVSDVLITPVIKERIPMMEQPLMLPLDDDNFIDNSESSDFNSSSTLTSASPNGLHGDEEKRKKLIINSDIEDGYHGQPTERILVNQGLIHTLEKRREKFIECELEQLVKSESLHSPDINGNAVDSRRQNEPETIIQFEGRKNKSTQSATEDEEPKISTSPIEDGLPRTRTSATHTRNDKVSNSIQRSDSFQSTRVVDEGIDTEEEEPKKVAAELSASHTQAAQSFEQRRSSFLADLENSKNLFNRRTSNELSISDAPSSLQSIEVMKSIMLSATQKGNSEKSTEVKEESIAPVPQVPNPIKETGVNSSGNNDAKNTGETKPWVYTGPPKINLGSWSERPKIQVCLKTDSDYHHSLQLASEKSEQPSLEENEPNKPATVIEDSPDKLPVIRSMELKKTISVPAEAPLSIAPSVVVETVAKPKIQRPVSMHSTRFIPTVRGFQGAILGRHGDDDEIRSTMINPVLMRSNSNVVAKLNGGIAMKSDSGPASIPAKEVASVDTVPVVADKPTALFSQSTLRRTGLKERILASQGDENVVKNGDTVRPNISFSLKPVSGEKSTHQQAISSPTSPPPPPPPPMTMMPIKAPGSLLNPLARLSNGPVIEQKVAQKPIVRGVVAKKSPQITPEVDPRAQLLDSIRNFSFNNVKKM